ncbi:hypothetical protein BC629DRAFT_1600479 [Irpex lacteus]|nr:hypothetical protein BC629DRAFT_1600479 [Irpex lacteus]
MSAERMFELVSHHVSTLDALTHPSLFGHSSRSSMADHPTVGVNTPAATSNGSAQRTRGFVLEFDSTGNAQDKPQKDTLHEIIMLSPEEGDKMHPLTASSQLVFTYPDHYYPRITAKLTEFGKPLDGVLGLLEDIRKLNDAARGLREMRKDSKVRVRPMLPFIPLSEEFNPFSFICWYALHESVANWLVMLVDQRDTLEWMLGMDLYWMCVFGTWPQWREGSTLPRPRWCEEICDEGNGIFYASWIKDDDDTPSITLYEHTKFVRHRMWLGFASHAGLLLNIQCIKLDS